MLRLAAVPTPWMPAGQRRSLLLLAVCQGLFQAASILVVTFSALVGQALAPSPALTTLPLAVSTVGAAVATIPASLLMRRIGRRSGFLLGTLLGAAGGVLSAAAISLHSFPCFCLGGLLLGSYQGFAQYYRFAAAELVPESARARAIGTVLTGGVAAALIAPELASWAGRADFAAPFAAPYLALVGLSLTAALLLLGAKFPPADPAERRGSGRPLRLILRQPPVMAALIGGAAGYAVMNLAMMATPLAMHHHHHGSDAAAAVIGWHVLAMFAPSFLSGPLIQRCGAPRAMAWGLGLLTAAVAAALAGTGLAHFALASILLGVGWNFLHVGATALLMASYHPAEKAKLQGANDFLIFGVVSLVALASGSLLHCLGWQAVNLAALALIGLAASALGRLSRGRFADGLANPPAAC